MRQTRCAPLLVMLGLALGACTGGTPAASRPSAGTRRAEQQRAAGRRQQPCSGRPGAPAAAPTASLGLAKIKIATTPSISNGGRYIADERGYFREEGLELEDVASDTSAQMLPSLAAGQIEIGAGGVAAGLFNAIAQGIPVRIVLDQWTAYPGNGAGASFSGKT